MGPKTRYTRDELKKAGHSCLTIGKQYWIRRYEIDFSMFPPHEPESIFLELQADDRTRASLRFFAPEFDELSPIRCPSGKALGPVYVVDKSRNGNEDVRRLEVGCNEDTGEPLFRASDVSGETQNTNECYVYFAFDGENFSPDDITAELGIRPTSVSRRREKFPDKMIPRHSSWNLSTARVVDEIIDVEAMASGIIEILQPKAHLVNELQQRFNVTTRLEVVLTVVSDNTKSTPAVGLSPETLRFLAGVGAYIDIDMYRN